MKKLLVDNYPISLTIKLIVPVDNKRIKLLLCINSSQPNLCQSIQTLPNQTTRALNFVRKVSNLTIGISANLNHTANLTITLLGKKEQRLK